MHRHTPPSRPTLNPPHAAPYNGRKNLEFEDIELELRQEQLDHSISRDTYQFANTEHRVQQELLRPERENHTIGQGVGSPTYKVLAGNN